MRELFLTSTTPYIVLFCAMLLCVGVCRYVGSKNEYKPEEERRIPKWFMGTVSTLMFIVGGVVLALYYSFGFDCLWWVTKGELGIWTRLFRCILFTAFVGLIFFSPFVYRSFMYAYSTKGTPSVFSPFLAIVIAPIVLIILFWLLNLLIHNTPLMKTIYFIVLGVIALGALIYSLKKNIGMIGVFTGIFYTLGVYMLCFLTLVSIIALLHTLVAVIAYMLPVIGVAIGIAILSSKHWSEALKTDPEQERFQRWVEMKKREGQKF